MENVPSDVDARLLQQLTTGKVDETEWRNFLGRIRGWICCHYPSLYAVSDELAGEAAVCAFESLASFRGEARFIRWVHRIAYHVVSRYLRKQAQAVVVSLEDIKDEAAGGDEIQSRLLQLAAEAAMETLTAQERIVFVSRVTNDTDHKDIALRLGITSNASRQTWMRASEKIARYRRENSL